MHARAGSVGTLSAAATATPTSTSPCSPTTAASTLHTKLEPLPGGDLIGAQLARERPGPVLDRLRLRARPVLQPRPTPPPQPPARAAPGRPADPATGRPPAAGAVASRGDRSASRAAWRAARVTLSGPYVLVELRHLYSNLLPGPETLAELRDRACARLRPADHAPVRQLQHRLRPARIEELIAAYRCGAIAAALAVQFQIHRTTVAALLQRQKIGSKSSG